jgi:hypothetical protein
VNTNGKRCSQIYCQPRSCHRCFLTFRVHVRNGPELPSCTSPYFVTSILRFILTTRTWQYGVRILRMLSKATCQRGLAMSQNPTTHHSLGRHCHHAALLHRLQCESSRRETCISYVSILPSSTLVLLRSRSQSRRLPQLGSRVSCTILGILASFSSQPKGPHRLLSTILDLRSGLSAP